jgi:hypothetical protein
MAVTMKIDAESLQRLGNMLSEVRNGLEKAIGRASRRVSGQGVTLISKDIRSKVNIKKEDLDKKVLSAKPSGKTSATVTLAATPRFPLKYFGAVQEASTEKKASRGVLYQIPKKGKKSLARGAFGPNIPRLGGHVFRRVGASRLPIQPLFGVSPWGVFVVNKMLEPTKTKLQKAFALRVMSEARNLIEKERTKKGK